MPAQRTSLPVLFQTRPQRAALRTRREPLALYALLFVLAGALCSLAITNAINPNDEGIVLQAAARIVHGQLPYRDFYANYGPGEYYLIALLNLVFGPSLLAWRILHVLLDASVAVLAYALVRRDAGPPLALLAWLAVAAALSFPQVPNPNTPMLALAFGALLTARRDPTAAGVLAGFAFVFRLDAGLAVIAGVLIAAFAEGGAPAAARAAGAALLVALLLVGPFVVIAPGEFWQQTFGFALHQQSLQRLPLPGINPGSAKPSTVLHHLYPYVLLAAAALWVAIAVRCRAPARAWAPAPLALAGVLYLLARADDFHLVPLAAVLPVLLASTVGRRPRSVAVAAAWIAVALIALEGLDQKRIQLANEPPSASIEAPAADGVEAATADAGALGALTRYVDARIPPAQPVLVAQPRYDLVNVGDPLLYVLLDRPNPTRYDVMQPGVVTTAGVQLQIVRSLERDPPRLIVRWLSPLADQAQPDGAGHSSGVDILGRYLARNYRATHRFGDYQVLRYARAS